jgi:Ca2+-binding RTX toxin-like protein
MNFVHSCPNVYVNGGTGNDRIIGAQCAEHLNGDAGGDSIFGNDGNDWIYGGDDNDCIDDETLSFLSCGTGTDSYTDDFLWKDCESQVSYCVVTP